MTSSPRWFTDTSPEHSTWYVERFRTLAAEGQDLQGEARLVDALVPPRSRILDAGCGPGRVGGALHERGHTVVGVDVDPVLISAAGEDHPGPQWLVQDLSALDLGAERFDLAVAAGNVMVFLAPDTERRVLERLRAHVRPGGKIVLGFRRDASYPHARLAEDATAVGLVVEHRFATWDLSAATLDDDFAVFVLRAPSSEGDD